jgi:hypothetical protein
VLTTGLLQQLVTLEHAPVGRRAIVIGAEHVSFSAILTLAHGGARTVAMVTEEPRHQSYRALAWATAGRRRVPILTRHRVESIHGRGRVEAVTVHDFTTDATRTLECDTVVFTGDWIPDHELARHGGLAMDPATRAPRVDGALRTSVAGVFAAGNLVHAAETADVAALSGRHAAAAVHAFLRGQAWPATAPVPIVAEAPIRWVSPSAVAGNARAVPHGHVLLRVDRFLERVEVEVRQDERLLARQRYRALVPGCSIHLRAGWLAAVNGAGAPVTVRIRPVHRR